MGGLFYALGYAEFGVKHCQLVALLGDQPHFPIGLDTIVEHAAAAMLDKPMWRKPDPVWDPGRGQGNTAGHAEG